MNELKVDLENCYGIKKLKYSFDFTKSKVQIIYAPNGSMKSSFAKTFEDISIQQESKDRIFTERVNHREVLVDGRDILEDEAFVINRMQDADFKSVSTILANETLKKEWDEINTKLNDTKKDFVKSIQPLFDLKENATEQTIQQVFGLDIYTFLENKENEIGEIIEPKYTNIIYNQIFNEKAYKFLKEKSFNVKIREYIETYDKIVNESTTLFKKGDFNHYNAENISKSLKDNGFFKAKHKVKIKNTEVADIAELEAIIKGEKEKILNSPELVSKFNEIDKALNANNELRIFRSYIENNQEIIKEFIDLENFKRKLILNYIALNKSQYDVFLKLYTETKKRRNELVLEAKGEQAEWLRVLKIFNDRFTVPFKVDVKNREDVILKDEPASLVFTYVDGEFTKELGGPEIYENLSTGEQRVFYILNIIFQIERQRRIDKTQLVIVDDIADSFDYKNKYAIIEYLKDIAEEPKFKMIILTHNFDFYKTILNRLEAANKWKCNFKAIKKENEIKLEVGEKNDVFPLLRDNFHFCKKSFISCIPFVRNLVQFSVGEENYNYDVLTSLLHIKQENVEKGIKATKEHTVQEVLDIFNFIFNKTEGLAFPNIKVYDLILETAKEINESDEEILDLKSKLCLSIAIRFKAEEFMLSQITDVNFLAKKRKKAGIMFGQYKKEFPNNETEKGILERVNLMTAENIHVNSFMYEPLMDLSEDHLRSLYKDVCTL
jgi:hypothetical protein